MSKLKKKVSKGLGWSSIQRFSTQFVHFIIGLILARLLSPTDYGLIGMLTIFMAISRTFIDSGFSASLIQKKNRDDIDYSTVFYFNLVIAVVLYLLLFFSAPLIARFYNQPSLIALTRMIGLTLIINSFGLIQSTKLIIKIDFKTQTKASTIATLISGIIGVICAYNGFGVWSLVIQSLLNGAVNVSILWIITKWYPKKVFSIERFKVLFRFGSKLLLSSLLDTTFKNIYLVVIGKIFSVSSLGFYTRAKHFTNYSSDNISGIIARVAFPILSEFQDDNLKLGNVYTKMIKMTALFIFPLMMGLAALAEPLIVMLLTKKWLGSAWMLQIICFSGMWVPIHMLNLNILNVKGRSDLFLKLEIIKKSLIVIILVISVPFGIKAMLIGSVVNSYLGLVINLYFSKKIINYGFWDQMNDLFPILILSFIMGLLIYFSINYLESNLLKLIVGFFEGLIFYISIAWIFKLGEIKEFPKLFRNLISR